MKFCKLITEVDLELLEELVDNGYPVDRIEENGLQNTSYVMPKFKSE